MSILTEQEITEIVREAARGSATRRDGSTSQRIAIVVEKAVLAKIKARGPTAWTDVKTGVVFVALNDSVTKCSAYMALRPLYRLPEGD